MRVRLTSHRATMAPASRHSPSSASTYICARCPSPTNAYLMPLLSRDRGVGLVDELLRGVVRRHPAEHDLLGVAGEDVLHGACALRRGGGRLGQLALDLVDEGQRLLVGVRQLVLDRRE